MKRLLALLLAAAAGAGGYWWWQSHSKDRLIQDLRDRLDRLEAETLTADVAVLGQRTAPDGTVYTKLSFVEYGAPPSPGASPPVVLRKTFEVTGQEFYIDTLTISFDDAFVEVGDGLRGKSLVLFRRAFGDAQRPVDGVTLYSANDDPVPSAVRLDGEDMAFQRRLWSRFWTLANDPAAAKAAGVRLAQGEAPHVLAQPGQVYELTLRASGGLELHPRLPAGITQAIGAGTGAAGTP